MPYSSSFDFKQVLLPGDHIAWPQGVGEPTGLTAALMKQSSDLPNTTLVLGMVTTSTLAEAESSGFEFLCLNGAAGTRKAAALSNNRVIPAHVSAIPKLILTRRIPVDVALIRVRSTLDPGMYSLGVMADYVHELVHMARIVVAEIDERMPETTGGDALLSKSCIDHFVTADGDEPLIFDPDPSTDEMAVAEHVAKLIPDRATVQFGVGGMPVAVCQALRGHKDLGLHSGVIADSAIDLIESGVITNRFKGIDEGVTVTGGLFGSRRTIEFADANSSIMLRRASYTHATKTMAQLNCYHTINSAVEIDLSGQLNSEVVGGRYIGAVGGQVDFVRGARLSENGCSIIAMTSTTPNGKHSKVVVDLGSSPVTTPRSDIDVVVTEYGVARLWGLDLPGRARALINVAHPEFRDQLREDFQKQSIRA